MGDPGQGWANCILYCLLTRKIRHRLLSCFCFKQNEDVGIKTENRLPSPSTPKNVENSTEHDNSSELQSVASDRTPLMSSETQEVPSVITGPVCGDSPPRV